MNRYMAVDKYKENIDNILNEIFTKQISNIEQASKKIAETLEKDGIIYITGSGHSHMIAEEIFYRAGGLAPIFPILEPSLMLHVAAERSSSLERLSGFSEKILEHIDITPQDIMIVISNSGRNAYPIETILTAQAIGCTTIAITSIKHSTQVSSRHKSGKKLYEIADIVVDNCGVYGDASVSIEGNKNSMGATSTIAGVFIIQSMILGAVEELSKKNVTVESFESANIDSEHDSDETIEMIKKWRKRIHLI